MQARCKHLDQIRPVTPSAEGCEECLKIGDFLGPPANVPHLRPCRLLRQLTQQARHQAFSRHEAPDHHQRRARRRLGLVLSRRDHVRVDDRLPEIAAGAVVRFGVCIPVEQSPIAAAAGWQYVEEIVTDLLQPTVPDSNWTALAQRAPLRSSYPCRQPSCSRLDEDHRP